MKRNIKSFALPLFSLIFSLVLTSVAVFAATGSSMSFDFELTANGDTSAAVSVGDEISFQVELKRTDEGKNGSYTMYSMQDEIIFDSSHLSMVEGSVIVAPSYDYNLRTMDDGVRERVILSRVVVNPDGAPTPDSLIIATFKLKALASIQNGSVISRNFKVNTKNGDTYITTSNDVSLTIAGLSPVSHAIRFISNDVFNSLPSGFKLLELTVASRLAYSAYEYDGKKMFYSSAYSNLAAGEHVYLDIVENDVKEADAYANIQVNAGSCIDLCYDKDVNRDGLVNSTDAVLIYGLYKGIHVNDPLFRKVSMQMRLEADVNGDGIVNTSDATTVLSSPWGK